MTYAWQEIAKTVECSRAKARAEVMKWRSLQAQGYVLPEPIACVVADMERQLQQGSEHDAAD